MTAVRRRLSPFRVVLATVAAVVTATAVWSGAPASAEPAGLVPLPRGFSGELPTYALLLGDEGSDQVALHLVPPQSITEDSALPPRFPLPTGDGVMTRFYALLQRTDRGALRVTPIYRVLPEPQVVLKGPRCQYRVSAAWRNALMRLSDEQLEQLVGIRVQKREISERRLRRLLDPTRVSRLQALESEYGLGGNQPLTESLPIEVLVARLSTLHARTLTALQGDSRASYRSVPGSEAR